jgi:predicted transglutaminase-like cysteine proteinase
MKKERKKERQHTDAGEIVLDNFIATLMHVTDVPIHVSRQQLHVAFDWNSL